MTFIRATLCGLLAALLVRAQDPAPPDAGFAVTTDFDHVLVYPDDGYNTLVDTYRPSVAPPAGGWPVLVMVHGIGGSRNAFRTVNPANPGSAERSTRRGYLVVAYDVRGHGALAFAAANAGKGTTIFNVRERRDLKLVIEDTLARYPLHADPARIGVTGASQGGAHTWMAAAWSGTVCDSTDPAFGSFPVISAVVAENFNSDFQSTVAPAQAMLSLAHAGTTQSTSLNILQSYRNQVNAWIDSEDYAALAAERSDPNNDVQARAGSITVPVLHMHACGDSIFTPAGPVALFQALPFATPRMMYLGTNGHGSPVNVEERLVREALASAWLDRWLKGTDNDAGEGPVAVWGVEPYASTAYLSGTTGLWVRRTSSAFPPPEASLLRFHLTSAGTLDPAAPLVPDTALGLQQTQVSALSASQARSQHWQVSTLLAAYPLQELVYVSAPLAADVELAGSFSAALHLTPLSGNWQADLVLGAQGGGETWRPIAAATYGERSAAPGAAGFRTLTGHPAAVRIPAGAQLVLRIRTSSVWYDFTAATLRMRATPVFGPFQVEVGHGLGAASSIDLPVLPAPLGAAVLEGSRSLAGVSVGGSHTWSLLLHGGAGGAGRTGVLGLSLSDTSPGLDLGTYHVALNYDALTEMTILSPTLPPWSNLQATLDASGRMTGTVSISTALAAQLAGFEVTAAAAILDASGLIAVSNPAGLVFGM